MKYVVMFVVLMASACPPKPTEPAPATATQKAADAGKAFAPAADAGTKEAPQKAADAGKPDASK